MLRARCLLTFSFVVTLLVPVSNRPAHADGPKDNLPDQVRPVPPVGIELGGEDREQLEAGLGQLNKMIRTLRRRRDARTPRLLPDIEIFARAVRDGLRHRELFSPRDVAGARRVLEEGRSRASALLEGQAPWTRRKGLVVRGFRSKIDRTVQPYGLVIPESYTFAGKDSYRLDLWLHGRGERASESVFIAQRMSQVGRFAPRDTFVLHPYGRYSNAFKFAGEIDVLEALEHARSNYRIDGDRISVRGFSMGGAGCWQLAVHYPDRFFAANPGAGFSETPEFLKFFQKETLDPTWYEKELWKMYDCTGYAVNLFQLPTVAYSGELDIQKQAADIMEQALAAEGLRLTHIIGPKTKHAIHPESMKVIERKMAHLAEQGRERLPRELRFATYTLKYNRMHWLTVTRLGQHWKQARARARIDAASNTIALATRNIHGLRLTISAGRSPFNPDQPVQIVLVQDTLKHTGPLSSVAADDRAQRIAGPRPGTDRSWDCELHFDGKAWSLGPVATEGLHKIHDLQGPIDDAFMDSFLIVRPTGTPRHFAVGMWTEAELERLVREWRRQFRGDALVKDDTDVTAQDMATHHLILFGDPSSNSVLKSVMGKLPIQWGPAQIKVANASYSSEDHAPVLIYPNPANPRRYVVVNSGFTYREYAYLNNARQVPKLPDWAVVDLRTPPDSLWPGRVVAAGFFDEQWQLRSDR